MRKSSTTRLLFSAMLLTGSVTVFGQAGNDAKRNELFRQEVSTYKPENSAYQEKWEPIMIENVAWKKRVWRTIDLSEKENELLTLTSVHPSIGDVLVNGLYNGAFTPRGAYTSDRFDNELNPGNIQSLKDQGLTGGRITSLKIKEDWIYLIKEKKVVVRIIAMAPVERGDDGIDYPVFWIYYPEARAYLAKQQIAAPGTSPSTLDEVFEGRFFTSTIDKVSEQIVEQPDPANKW